MQCFRADDRADAEGVIISKSSQIQTKALSIQNSENTENESASLELRSDAISIIDGKLKIAAIADSITEPSGLLYADYPSGTSSKTIVDLQAGTVREGDANLGENPAKLYCTITTYPQTNKADEDTLITGEITYLTHINNKFA